MKQLSLKNIETFIPCSEKHALNVEFQPGKGLDMFRILCKISTSFFDKLK